MIVFMMEFATMRIATRPASMETMTMTDTPDTSPEAVERLAKDHDEVGDSPDKYVMGHPHHWKTAATLRALSAALEQMTAIKDIHQVKRHEYFERAEAAEAERDALKAELAAARQDALSKMSPYCAPKGVPVLVAGGIAMRKTGDEWLSGMCEPAFSRPLTWQPQWWAPIPQQNEPPRAFLARHQKETDT